jgi:hypothetical protein
MPKNPVSDPITDQEIHFARLVLSGTMTDRRAAEAAGLNPESAAYTKAKPRVRAYMIEHRAAVKEKLVDQEVDGLRKLNFDREQLLNRLWELATLSHEATRGSIAGQLKALALIASIEGMIPDRRFSPSAAQPTTPPVEPNIYKSEWLRKQQEQAAGKEPGDPMPPAETQPAAPQPAAAAAPSPSEPDLASNQPSLAGSLVSQASTWVPQATGRGFDALLDSRQPFSIKKGRFGRR